MLLILFKEKNSVKKFQLKFEKLGWGEMGERKEGREGNLWLIGKMNKKI